MDRAVTPSFRKGDTEYLYMDRSSYGNARQRKPIVWGNDDTGRYWLPDEDPPPSDPVLLKHPEPLVLPHGGAYELCMGCMDGQWDTPDRCPKCPSMNRRRGIGWEIRTAHDNQFDEEQGPEPQPRRKRRRLRFFRRRKA
jgi:hypothetical protein